MFFSSAIIHRLNLVMTVKNVSVKVDFLDMFGCVLPLLHLYKFNVLC